MQIWGVSTAPEGVECSFSHADRLVSGYTAGLVARFASNNKVNSAAFVSNNKVNNVAIKDEKPSWNGSNTLSEEGMQ